MKVRVKFVRWICRLCGGDHESAAQVYGHGRKMHLRLMKPDWLEEVWMEVQAEIDYESKHPQRG